MSDLHNFNIGKSDRSESLNKFEKFTIYYHDLFEYPLSFSELLCWTPTKLPQNYHVDCEIACENNYYFLTGKSRLVYKRIFRKRSSEKKMIIAKKASKILSLIPSVKMVAISGSLAMQNAAKESDIDLFIITRANTLWLSRLVILFLFSIFQIPVRRSGDKEERDKLCLNMWMDEGDLIWKEPRNIYTAHEIAQLIPLVNKEKTHEKFLYQNKWVINYWPNAVKIKDLDAKVNNFFLGTSIIEKLAFKLQYLHMKNRISREVITPTRAIFHPNDLSKFVLAKLHLT
jgi:predicted nucleotidyltransferase